MSTPAKTRKTAFARKPRGDTSTDKKPKKTIINREYLQKIKDCRIDDTLNDVLTATGGTLTIELRAQGGSSVTIIDKKGTVVADDNDVTRILTMNATITKEKTKVVKEASKGSIVRVLWALREYANGLPDTAALEEIPAGMRDIIMKMEITLQNLKANADQIAEKSDLSPSDQEIKNYLLIQNMRIRNAIVNYLVGKISNYDNAEVLNVHLRRKNVPIWVYSKLTGQKVNLSQKGYEFRYILFPKDPSKGLCFSFAEIRDIEFLRAQGTSVLEAAHFAHRFLIENDFISAFCNVEDVTNEETMKLLANVPIMIPEFAVETKTLVNNLADQGIRQYSWPVGYAVSPKDNLQFLGTLFKRASVVAITRPQFQVGLIEQLFSGFVFDPTNRTANIFQQLKERLGETTHFTAKVLHGNVDQYNRSGAVRLAVFNLLTCILDLNPADPVRVPIIRRILCIQESGALTSPNDSFVITVSNNYTLENDTWGPISIGANTVDTKNPNVVALDQSTRPVAGKKAEKKVSLQRQTVAHRSLPTAEAKSVAILLKTLKYKSLVAPVDLYFRGFLSTTVQAAVARLMFARIAGILAKPEKLARKDLADMLDLDAVLELEESLDNNVLNDASDDDDSDGGGSDSEDENPTGTVVS